MYPFKKICVVGTIIVLTLSSSLLNAQERRRGCPPDCGPEYTRSRVHVTYEGRVFISLPNYDVAIDGTPALPGQMRQPMTGQLANGQPTRFEPRIIFRNNQGMYWDGGSYFVSPNYNYGLLTRNYYSQRYVGETSGWPVLASQPSQVETHLAGPTIYEWAPPSTAPHVAVPQRTPVPMPNLPPVPYPPTKQPAPPVDLKSLKKMP